MLIKHYTTELSSLDCTVNFQCFRLAGNLMMSRNPLVLIFPRDFDPVLITLLTLHAAFVLAREAVICAFSLRIILFMVSH
jgi:hypothetical protein